MTALEITARPLADADRSATVRGDNANARGCSVTTPTCGGGICGAAPAGAPSFAPQATSANAARPKIERATMTTADERNLIETQAREGWNQRTMIKAACEAPPLPRTSLRACQWITKPA